MEAIGATAVGMVCKDGVVLASEKRVAYGYTILSKAGKKVFKITNHLGIACAGVIADMQMLAKSLTAEANLFELNYKRPMKVRNLAKLLSTILYSSRLMPYMTEVIIAGVDTTGPHLYVLDPLGSLIEDKYVALGSGAMLAISVMESEYSPDITTDIGEEIAIKAIKAAVKRDIISGDGIDLLIIKHDETLEKFILLETI
ncbi:MAG: archaeal proteasome endopeptidase complex subunit beta [Candidatus Methanomethylicia archaeon]|nr:archaeal proteasome endopeptidase complex subunit beta [Candidatus Methanomethylicia archaeon]MCX8169098.1 archaeal proteasome endopeptidase complex subunit beta [Candidatus Methanomethylicia archaeon]MDW7988830.1 archaeal proteasome endopeptidase complex subunit beta [Nitrososphaerota archaeon]